jgi:PTS system N-acetylglucosamine-specific IIC component
VATPVSPGDGELSRRLLDALGGDRNVAALEGSATRILATLRDAALVRDDDLSSMGLRGIARPSPLSIHLLVGPETGGVLQEMRRLLA